MFETIEFFDNDGSDLNDVIKSCILKYYVDSNQLNGGTTYI